MSRLHDTFQALRRDGRKALIPYITPAYPCPGVTPALMHAMVQAGANVIELGMPFSDPSADGPAIQEANEQSLANGMNLPQVLAIVEEFRRRDQRTPVVLMGYANPIEQYDQHARAGAFAADAGRAGVDGVLVVDYPLEVSAELSRELQRHGMDMILLLTPAASDERIRLIAERASGYAYCVSVKGVTGVRSLDLDQVRHTLRRARRHISLPLGVGFGIRDAATAQAVAQMSDAVIVGSWLLETLRGKTAEQALQAAGALIQNLRRHLDATKASAS
ncbi:tryptophan synthase subunit alpha [Alcaligenes sp. Marseille-Q7550]